jgi:hypothetical protein
MTQTSGLKLAKPAGLAFEPDKHGLIKNKYQYSMHINFSRVSVDNFRKALLIQYLPLTFTA